MTQLLSNRRHHNAFVRVLRWKAESCWQVWLVDAPVVSSGFLIGGLALGSLLPGLVMACIAFIGRGAVESYRLDRRRDATAVAEWAEARYRSSVR